MLKAVRGTRDLLPPDTDLWNRVEAKVRALFARYNYHEIRTPVFEDTQLFSRSVGEETDIVSKEMFTWEDRARAQSEKAQSLTLRPENTAGVVRAYIEHRLGDKGTLQKLYYIGPQFRRERPQKGRYRQFYQIGAEIIGPPSAGSESPARDAEVLEMLATLLDEVGLRGWQLQLNSVGCAEDRARYNKALREALQPVVHQMCADCQRRAETNPLRVLDCKVPEDQPIIETLPKISRYLDEPCREHFAAVRAMLDAVGVPYSINERMVRGLDYYTRTTFEFTHGGLGAQSAVLGGGRYDGLSESLDGPKAPGIGFAIGEDRLVLALQSQGENSRTSVNAYIAPVGVGMNPRALMLARKLRRAGVSVDVGDENFRLKKAFEAADRMSSRFIVIFGPDELAGGVYKVKELSTGVQVSVPGPALDNVLLGRVPLDQIGKPDLRRTELQVATLEALKRSPDSMSFPQLRQALEMKLVSRLSQNDLARNNSGEVRWIRKLRSELTKLRNVGFVSASTRGRYLITAQGLATLAQSNPITAGAQEQEP